MSPCFFLAITADTIKKIAVTMNPTAMHFIGSSGMSFELRMPRTPVTAVVMIIIIIVFLPTSSFGASVMIFWFAVCTLLTLKAGAGSLLWVMSLKSTPKSFPMTFRK